MFVSLPVLHFTPDVLGRHRTRLAERHHKMSDTRKIVAYAEGAGGVNFEGSS